MTETNDSETLEKAKQTLTFIMEGSAPTISEKLQAADILIAHEQTKASHELNQARWWLDQDRLAFEREKWRAEQPQAVLSGKAPAQDVKRQPPRMTDEVERHDYEPHLGESPHDPCTRCGLNRDDGPHTNDPSHQLIHIGDNFIDPTRPHPFSPAFPDLRPRENCVICGKNWDGELHYDGNGSVFGMQSPEDEDADHDPEYVASQTEPDWAEDDEDDLDPKPPVGKTDPEKQHAFFPKRKNSKICGDCNQHMNNWRHTDLNPQKD